MWWNWLWVGSQPQRATKPQHGLKQLCWREGAVAAGLDSEMCLGGKKTNKKPTNHVFKTYISAENIKRVLERHNRAWTRTTPLLMKEWVVDWEPYSGDSLIFPVQPLSSRDSQLLLFSKAGWVRKLLTPLFPPCIFISATPNGPESSYNQLSGHLWLLWNGVTQPNYIRKRTSFICSHKLNKPREEKTQAPEKTHAYIS